MSTPVEIYLSERIKQVVTQEFDTTKFKGTPDFFNPGERNFMRSKNFIQIETGPSAQYDTGQTFSGASAAYNEVFSIVIVFYVIPEDKTLPNALNAEQRYDIMWNELTRIIRKYKFTFFKKSGYIKRAAVINQFPLTTGKQYHPKGWGIVGGFTFQLLVLLKTYDFDIP